MNTHAHAVVNLTLLGRAGGARQTAAILFGSVVPDLQILGFYVVEKVLWGTSEAEIWGSRYFDVHEYFDWLNSIPLAALGVWLCHRSGRTTLRGLFAGILLHTVADLLTHHDDAHRHFLPFSGWRFLSPVSYWDPAYYGFYFAGFEALLVWACCVLLWQRHRGRMSRVALTLVCASYVIVGGVVAAWWWTQ